MSRWTPKKWGGEIEICNTPDYCGKKMILLKDHHCSFHYHKNKKEHFFIEQGSVYLIKSDYDALEKSSANLRFSDDIILRNIQWNTSLTFEQRILLPGDSVEILPNVRHLFYGLEYSEFFEFSTYHEDSDSYRLTESY